MPDTQTQTVTVHVPTPLRKYTGGDATVDVSGDTVGGVLHALVEQYPDLESNLYTDDGTLRQFVNVYVGDDDIRYRDGVDTPVTSGDAVSIVPSIAGG